jgi:hypothetical protein
LERKIRVLEGLKSGLKLWIEGEALLYVELPWDAR